MNIITRALLVWLLIAAAETLHGIVRVRLLNRRMGDRRARQIGVGTGSVIILTIAWATAPWIGVRSVQDALGVGALWLVLMLGFDLGLGRLVFHFPWQRLIDEFNPRKGGLLAFGMLVLACAPLAVAIGRGMIPLQ